MMTTDDLSPNLLVQTPANEILKVSTVYGPQKVTAEVKYPLQPRTIVRAYTADEIATWREPSNAMIAKYETAWGYR